MSKIIENIRYSDKFEVFLKKYEKYRKILRKAFFIWFGLQYVIYFFKHINPIHIQDLEIKESSFYRYTRRLFNFIIDVALTGVSVNFVLWALLNFEFTRETMLAYGLGWWIIQKQILKKSSDYLSYLIKTSRGYK